MKAVKDKERDRRSFPPRTRLEMSVNMTGTERFQYEEWKAERSKVDQDRLSRQKNNAGEWRRAWDHDKAYRDYEEPPSPNRTEPAKRPVGRIGSGRFDRGDREERRADGLSQSPKAPSLMQPSSPVESSERRPPSSRGRGRGRGRIKNQPPGVGPASQGDKPDRPRTWSGGDDSRTVQCSNDNMLVVKIDKSRVVDDHSVEVEYEFDDSEKRRSSPSKKKPGRRSPTKKPQQRSYSPQFHDADQPPAKTSPRSHSSQESALYEGRPASLSQSLSLGSTDDWEEGTGPDASYDDPHSPRPCHGPRLNPDAPAFQPTSPDILRVQPRMHPSPRGQRRPRPVASRHSTGSSHSASSAGSEACPVSPRVNGVVRAEDEYNEDMSGDVPSAALDTKEEKVVNGSTRSTEALDKKDEEKIVTRTKDEEKNFIEGDTHTRGVRMEKEEFVNEDMTGRALNKDDDEEKFFNEHTSSKALTKDDNEDKFFEAEDPAIEEKSSAAVPDTAGKSTSREKREAGESQTANSSSLADELCAAGVGKPTPPSPHHPHLPRFTPHHPHEIEEDEVDDYAPQTATQDADLRLQQEEDLQHSQQEKDLENDEQQQYLDVEQEENRQPTGSEDNLKQEGFEMEDELESTAPENIEEEDGEKEDNYESAALEDALEKEDKCESFVSEKMKQESGEEEENFESTVSEKEDREKAENSESAFSEDDVKQETVKPTIGQDSLGEGSLSATVPEDSELSALCEESDGGVPAVKEVPVPPGEALPDAATSDEEAFRKDADSSCRAAPNSSPETQQMANHNEDGDSHRESPPSSPTPSPHGDAEGSETKVMETPDDSTLITGDISDSV